MQARTNQTSFYAGVFSKPRTKEEYNYFLKDQNMHPNPNNDEEMLFLVLNVIQFRRWGGHRWDQALLKGLIELYGEKPFMNVLKALTLFQALHFKTYDNGGYERQRFNSLYYDVWPYKNEYVSEVKKVLDQCGNTKICGNFDDMHYIGTGLHRTQIIGYNNWESSGNGLPFFLDDQFINLLKTNYLPIYQAYLTFITHLENILFKYALNDGLFTHDFNSYLLDLNLHDAIKYDDKSPLGCKLVDTREAKDKIENVLKNSDSFRSKIGNLYNLLDLFQQDANLALSQSHVSSAQANAINIDDYLNDSSATTLTASILSAYLNQMPNNTAYDYLTELADIYNKLMNKLHSKTGNDYQNDNIPLFGSTREEKINDHIKLLKNKLLEIVKSNIVYQRPSIRYALENDHVKALIDHFRKDKKQFTATREKLFEYFPSFKEAFQSKKQSS